MFRYRVKRLLKFNVPLPVILYIFKNRTLLLLLATVIFQIFFRIFCKGSLNSRADLEPPTRWVGAEG